ncbi:MAG: hypothetical protein HUK03_00990 [Bacteroidaceae bacterium]|mgnify:CR=1 FL=1|nr:hypothetical protein [Bacteroidaceae bacterium]
MTSPEEKELEEQVARIRRKRQKYSDHTTLRNYLNTAFLALAAVGMVWYFTTNGSHIPPLMVVGAGMLLKVAEFVVRFFF